MIKHALKDDLIHLSINKIDFSYRIPVKKIGNTIDWKIGKKDTKGIVIKNVSAWTLNLFTNKTTEDKYIKQFKSIVEEYASDHTINWEETLLAVSIQNQYNWLITSNNTAEKKISEDEIISILKKKYKLD